MNKMFCFQCEQTAGCSGCTGNAGVCGKSDEVANLQDELTGELIGLAKGCFHHPGDAYTTELMIEALFTTITNVNFNEKTVMEMIERVRQEKERISPGCITCASRCGDTDAYDMKSIWEADEDIRSLKSLILFGIRGMAAYAYHAMLLGYRDEKVDQFFVKALAVLGYDLGMADLLPVVLEVGEVNLACMELLDRANRESFGDPKPVTAPLSLVRSWYEQKAVCILLTLLHLGIENIRLGPTLPAFLSRNVLNYLVENYHIAPTTTAEEDLKALITHA